MYNQLFRMAASARPVLLVLRRNRRLRRFGLPHDANNEPSMAVVQELEAVDAAGERLPTLLVPRLVGTENMRDVGVTLLRACAFTLKESLLGEGAAAVGNVVFDAQDA